MFILISEKFMHYDFPILLKPITFHRLTILEAEKNFNLHIKKRKVGDRMKKNIIFLAMIFYVSLNAFVEIYDIQFTENPGDDGTYPSLLLGQTVETGGIVSGVDFSEGRYFISHPDGGTWNGVYVYDDDHSPQIGDEIVITGEVVEYYGFTEISYVSSYETLSSGNNLPEAIEINCSDVEEEAYESVLVKVSNIEVNSLYDQYGGWTINDENSNANIGTGFFSLEEYGFPLIEDYPIASIIGINSYSWGEFYLNPRSINDFSSTNGGIIISVENQNHYSQTPISVPINLSVLTSNYLVNSFSISLSYDESILSYLDCNSDLIDENLIDIQSDSGNLVIASEEDFNFGLTESLLNIEFSVLNSGNAGIEFEEAIANNQEISYQDAGEIIVVMDVEGIGDTLTTIQKPILNIPEIVTPGEQFEIWCAAEENVENWQAELVYKDYQIAVDIEQVEYQPILKRYILSAVAPAPIFYELFDLHITADSAIDDTSKNAVQVVSQELDDFSFIHISDTHLPTHYFWGDDPELALNDSSEIEDFRQVIKDINILNPEFVIFTGDIVNEGELEDFENGRYYTKAQRLLTEFEVPVYLVSGNHDLGGWSSTPPEDGTARRDWWRFFGWKWLAEEDSPSKTQDYSFTYGNNYFIGMEAYLNYDYYMYDIYGSQSFIPNQIEWLDMELANSADYENRIIFYHYDFSENINLEQMDIDMALYGHIHSNDGSINYPPYNLAVDCVCDETRAYRVIDVIDGELSPRETQYATWPNDNLNVTFSPDNSGMNSAVTINIENQFDSDFDNCLIKVKMPFDSGNISATNSNIEQIIELENKKIVYLKFDLEANSEKEIVVHGNSSIDNNDLELLNFQCFPNPVEIDKQVVNISFSLPHSINTAELQIFNLKGQKIYSERKNITDFHWNGKDFLGKNVSSGIYFFKILCDDKIYKSDKLMIIK